MTKIFYFGCIGRPGHYMHRASGYRDYGVVTPWGQTPDCTLCPGLRGGLQVQGQARLHHKDGWTAIGFWDRSVDRRSNSNSNFLAVGILSLRRDAGARPRDVPAGVFAHQLRHRGGAPWLTCCNCERQLGASPRSWSTLRDGGIQLRFLRELGEGDVRSELLILLTVDQAKAVGRALLDAGGVPHG